eukprot:129322-Heterocapsa_arctica.AAC.1
MECAALQPSAPRGMEGKGAPEQRALDIWIAVGTAGILAGVKGQRHARQPHSPIDWKHRQPRKQGRGH